MKLYRLFMLLALLLAILMAPALVLPARAAKADADHVLFVTINGGYNSDGANAFNMLVAAGADADYVVLSSDGQVAAALNSAELAGKPYDQIWVYDLSSGADNYPSDYAAIVAWFNSRPDPELICDGRFLSSYWGGRWNTEGRALAQNYYANLAARGGGLLLATDHDDYSNRGVSEIAALLGINQFSGEFGGSFPVDSTNPLMTTPNDLTGGLANDSTTGQAPFNLQPNGLILHTVGFHSGNPLTPGISSTIDGSLNFTVAINQPASGILLCSGDTVLATTSVNNQSDPVTYAWSSSMNGPLGTAATQLLEFASLSKGAHTITVLAKDAADLYDDNSIRITVGGPDCDTDGDGVADDSDNCPTLSNADQANADGDGLGDACDPNAYAPVATDSAVTTNEDVRKSITLAASDADGDELIYTIVGNPVNGVVSVSGNTATYTPTANYNGSDSFTFQANDGQADSNIATVVVTVRPVNDRPTVVNERITLPEDSSDVLIDVLANDADVEGDSLSLLRVGTPNRAGAVRIEGNALRYSPAANFNGTETFTYTVSDGRNGVAGGRVTAVVVAVNDAPNTVVTATVSSNSASFAFSAEDVDSTLFTYQCALDGGVFTACTSPKAYSGLSFGAHSFQVRARDNRGLADPTPASHSWTVASATLTIVLDTQPDTGLNRTFASPTLPHFWLDDTPDVSDTDAYTHTKSLTVLPGVYTFTETALKGWHLRDILCSAGANAAIDQATRTVAITVAAGEHVTCTFTEQLRGVVVVRSFIDGNGNGVKAGSEPYTNGVTLRLYSAHGVVAATQSTVDLLRDGIVSPGYTSFKNVRPGVYTLCVVTPAGWVATRPVTLMTDYDNLPCFAPVTVAPGRGVSYLVGNQPATLTAAMPAESATDAEATAEATAQAELAQWLATELQALADEANAVEEGHTPAEEAAFGPNPLFLPLVRNADAVVDAIAEALPTTESVTESVAEVPVIVMVSEPTDADMVDEEAHTPAPAESVEAETVVNEAVLLRLFLPVVRR